MLPGMHKDRNRIVIKICVLCAISAVTFGCGRLEKLKERVTRAKSFREINFHLGENVDLTLVKIKDLNIWVGKHEVSNKQYRRFKADHNSGSHKGYSLNGDNLPVVNVSWTEATNFCWFLNRKFGFDGKRKVNFRLPKENEWEVYATGGKPTRFPWGDNWPPPNKLNYYGEENREVAPRIFGHRDAYPLAAPVEKSGANSWGLYGVGGNAWEWCDDLYQPDSKYRIYRGASWADSADFFLATDKRNYNEETYRGINLGFRVVAEIQEITPEEKQKLAEEERAKKTRLLEEEAAKKELEKQKTELAEKELKDKQAAQQLLIEKNVQEKAFDVARKNLEAYSAEYGKDNFYSKWSLALKNIRIIKLSDETELEFAWIDALKLWVGKYEITNKQYKKFDPAHDSKDFKGNPMDQDDQPVVYVSWDDANAFCGWMNQRFKDQLREGEVFRLPGEKEWEAFAACGQEREFPWGNQWPPSYGNYGSIEDYDDKHIVTCPVDKSDENEWNLFGVGGNVWEWCEDWLDSDKQRRVFKGGAWNLTQPHALKISNHAGDIPGQRNSYIGFRVVIGKN